MTADLSVLTELRARLAEIADLERVARPAGLGPGGDDAAGRRRAPRRAARARSSRLAHERFVDDRVGELLEQAEPETDIDADTIRVARRDFDKARRVPADLVLRNPSTGSR